MWYIIWGFPKIRGTFLGVPIVRTIVFGGLYWVPLFWETTIWGSSMQGTSGCAAAGAPFHPAFPASRVVGTWTRNNKGMVKAYRNHVTATCQRSCNGIYGFRQAMKGCFRRDDTGFCTERE